MKHLALALLALTLIGCQGEDPDPDQELFQGTWKCVRLWSQGKEVKDIDITDSLYTFENNRVIIKSGDTVSKGDLVCWKVF